MILLRPISACSSWALACHLAKSARADLEAELAKLDAELVRRGKSRGDIDEMVAFARWALEILNPIDGRTRESGGRVHQVVADADDLDLAVEIAERDGTSDPRFTRDVIRRHAELHA